MAKQLSGFDKATAVHEALHKLVPHFYSVLASDDEFIELRLKARDDGTTLAILKRYDSAGGREVCFGVGYGVALALCAIDATVQGGHWRTDKPWQPPKQ